VTTFLADVRRRAAAASKRIVFSEGDDARTRDAVRALLAESIVRPMVLCTEDGAAAEEMRAAGADVVIPSAHDFTRETAAAIVEERARKGMTEEEARALARQPVYFSAALVVPVAHREPPTAGTRRIFGSMTARSPSGSCAHYT
jgi:phosphate acetyltransferase